MRTIVSIGLVFVVAVGVSVFRSQHLPEHYGPGTERWWRDNTATIVPIIVGGAIGVRYAGVVGGVVGVMASAFIFTPPETATITESIGLTPSDERTYLEAYMMLESAGSEIADKEYRKALDIRMKRRSRHAGESAIVGALVIILLQLLRARRASGRPKHPRRNAVKNDSWFTRMGIMGRIRRVVPQYLSKDVVSHLFSLTKREWEAEVDTIVAMEPYAEKSKNKDGTAIGPLFQPPMFFDVVLKWLHYDQGDTRPSYLQLSFFWARGQEPLLRNHGHDLTLEKVASALAPEFKVDMIVDPPTEIETPFGFSLHFVVTDQHHPVDPVSAAQKQFWNEAEKIYDRDPYHAWRKK